MRFLISLLLISLLLGSFAITSSSQTVKINGTTIKINGVKWKIGNLPSDFATDTFTESSDTNLQLHIGEVGSTWTLHTSYSGTVLVNASLDEIYLNTSSTAAYYASGTPPSANYCTQGSFSRKSSLSNNVGLWLAVDTATDTGILLRLNDNGAGTVVYDLFDRQSGSNNNVTPTVSGVAAHIPTIGGASVQVTLCRAGTSLTAFFDGVQDTTFNSTTAITATGKAGLRFSGQASSTTGIHIDNFSAR